jgi:hypothetical protein
MSPQQSFLLDQYFSLSLQAATQRAGVWAPLVPEAARKELHCHLQELLEKTQSQYASGVTEAAHVKNIGRIASSLTRRHAGLLFEGRFRVGPAQKALNLYLKFIWCAGYIPNPPHCPVDAVVLRAVKLSHSIRWTKIDSITEYMVVIDALKSVAGPKTLAEWELAVWARREASRGRL